MAQQKTSLEKSHSAWSNTKLTFLCVETILVHSALWSAIALTLFNKIPTSLGTIVIGCFAILTVLSLLLFNKFKR